MIAVKHHHGFVRQVQRLQFIQHAANLLVKEANRRIIRMTSFPSHVVGERMSDIDIPHFACGGIPETLCHVSHAGHALRRQWVLGEGDVLCAVEVPKALGYAPWCVRSRKTA